MVQVLAALLRLSNSVGGSPFLSPGLAPFTADLLLDLLHGGGNLGLEPAAMAYAGLTFIMLATYYSNEYFDYEVDGINRDYNKFGGGSMVPSEGLLSRWAAFKAFIGTVTHSQRLHERLKLYYHARPRLIAVGLLGCSLLGKNVERYHEHRRRLQEKLVVQINGEKYSLFTLWRRKIVSYSNVDGFASEYHR